MIGLSKPRTTSWPGGIVGARRAGSPPASCRSPSSVAVQQAAIEQPLHQRRQAADLDELGHHVLAARLQVGEHRHALADAREVVDATAARPAACAIASRCSTALVEPPSAMTMVIAFSNALRVRMSRGRMPRSISCTTAAPARAQSSRLVVGDRRLRRAVRQAQAERLDRRRHGVGGVHAAARAGAGARVLLEIGERGVATACRPRAAPPLRTPRRCRPAGPGRCRAGWCRRRRTRGPVEPRHRHHAAGMFLSQPPMATRPSKPSAPIDGLDRVGDHFARHQRVLHALGAHRDAVGDGDGVEDHGLAAGAVDAVGARAARARRCARCTASPGSRSSRCRPVTSAKSCAREADGVQHRAAGRALGAVETATSERMRSSFAGAICRFTTDVRHGVNMQSANCATALRKQARWHRCTHSMAPLALHE